MSFNQRELAILALIDLFVSGNMKAPEFEKQYVASWREYRDCYEPKNRDKAMQRYFDSVFSAVDTYCADPDLIDEDDLDDQGLLNTISILKASWEESILA
ncbi:colicin immunity domain-containing protein [Serratia sp. NPDC078593]|uniref:colicin immunity domain-containing protein n=1 Tax=unclassified Serratia (in: enterobacteria) TaxID=2647522 RepID=UPI0037D94DC9